MPYAIELTLLNDRRESTTCFERPAEQVLVLYIAIEPRAKQGARFVLCHTCQ